jgi:hypothetical protein
MDIWRVPFLDFPPQVANSITGTDPPTLSSQQAKQDTALSGWETVLNQGDVLAFVINSVSGLRTINLELAVSRN